MVTMVTILRPYVKCAGSPRLYDGISTLPREPRKDRGTQRGVQVGSMVPGCVGELSRPMARRNDRREAEMLCKLARPIQPASYETPERTQPGIPFLHPHPGSDEPVAGALQQVLSMVCRARRAWEAADRWASTIISASDKVCCMDVRARSFPRGLAIHGTRTRKGLQERCAIHPVYLPDVRSFSRSDIIRLQDTAGAMGES